MKEMISHSIQQNIWIQTEMKLSDDDDAFPYDPTQQKDSDGDGYGDNKDGI